MKRKLLLLFTLFCLGVGTGRAQYVVLHNFGSFSGDGKSPFASLILSGNTLYGMTTLGGTYDSGCIFSIDTNGNRYKKLLDFKNTKGAYPYGSLIISGNILYGMTCFGGANGKGCIFSIDTTGTQYKKLFDFNGANGETPHGALILSGGILYGMTPLGGAHNYGCVFHIDTNGNRYSDLFDFDGGGALGNGEQPLGSLILCGKVLYGMTFEEGVNGNIFSLDTNGSEFKQLHFFDYYPMGDIAPRGSLTLSGGALYGMTSTARFGAGNIFSIDTNGNGYKDLNDFIGGLSGGSPDGSLALSRGILYGMANNIFSIDTNGSGFRTLYNFNYITGIYPFGDLTLSGNMVYGMTNMGGTDSVGVIFSLNYVTAGINNLTPVTNVINLFPNPSSGSFNLSLSNITEKCNIEIYNVMGERVKSEELRAKSEELDLTGQPNGVYFYRVIKESGEVLGSGKIIVQR